MLNRFHYKSGDDRESKHNFVGRQNVVPPSRRNGLESIDRADTIGRIWMAILVLLRQGLPYGCKLTIYFAQRSSLQIS